jgi:hypothetical protein
MQVLNIVITKEEILKSLAKDKPQKGSYKAQKELSIEEADELAAEAKRNPNKDIFLLFSYATQALNYAVDIAKMTRSKESWPVEQFVAMQVRLSEYVKRIDTYPNIINMLKNWPPNPGITFAWLSGPNALELAIQFIRMIHTGVISARGEIAFHGVTSYDNLMVCPKPDPAFEKWQDQTIKELLAHEISKPDIWPTMADIHREYQSLLYKLQDEYNRAINVKNQNSIETEAQKSKFVKIITCFKKLILVIYEKTAKAFFDSCLGK